MHGRIVIASYPQRAKSANLRRDPRASVAVLSDEFNGAYVQVDGDAEVVDSARCRRAAGRLLPVPSRASTPTGTSTAARWSTREVPDQDHSAAVGSGGHRRIPARLTRRDTGDTDGAAVVVTEDGRVASASTVKL